MTFKQALKLIERVRSNCTELYPGSGYVMDDELDTESKRIRLRKRKSLSRNSWRITKNTTRKRLKSRKNMIPTDIPRMKILLKR